MPPGLLPTTVIAKWRPHQLRTMLWAVKSHGDMTAGLVGNHVEGSAADVACRWNVVIPIVYVPPRHLDLRLAPRNGFPVGGSEPRLNAVHVKQGEPVEMG